MNKRDEMQMLNSWLNRAKDDEPVFVLLGRDASAPGAIYEWIGDRILSGKNDENDKQIKEAREVAHKMVAYWNKRRQPASRTEEGKHGNEV